MFSSGHLIPPISAPVVSSVNPINGVLSGGTSLTVWGGSFAVVDMTTSSRLGSSSCVTATWVSATSAVCGVSPSNVADWASMQSVLTVESVMGTQTAVFTFDGYAPTVLQQPKSSLSSQAPAPKQRLS